MKMTLSLQLGMRVKYLREKSKISQEDLGFNAGLSKNYISDIECGRRNPTLKALSKIAKGLRVDLSTLLLGIGSKNN